MGRIRAALLTVLFVVALPAVAGAQVYTPGRLVDPALVNPPDSVPSPPRGEYPEDWAKCVAETNPTWPTAPPGIDPRAVDPATPNPLLEIEVAVERVWPESRGELAPFLPRARLTLEQAIHAFTMGSAYVNHLDDSTGSVSVGKLADLAIVDRDLFAPDAGPIGDARVLGTFVGGASVFEDSALG